MGIQISRDELPHTEQVHEFVGKRAWGRPLLGYFRACVAWRRPSLHRHPYPEVFVLESGTATTPLGDGELVVHGGEIVVAPANMPHGFTNTGADELRLTSIHSAAEFNTEWLAGHGPV